jgi:crotonobetainyl-CoA:carnitine CoA-transferase CaiB-like acyl-CoA transferase
VIAVGSDAQWLACVRALEIPELMDEALRTNAGRLAQRERVVTRLAARLRERAAAEWRVRLDAVGVPTGVVRSVPEVLDGSAASPSTGMPPAVPGTIRLRPPRLGEHTERVRALGWSAFTSQG